MWVPVMCTDSNGVSPILFHCTRKDTRLSKLLEYVTCFTCAVVVLSILGHVATLPLIT